MHNPVENNNKEQHISYKFVFLNMGRLLLGSLGLRFDETSS